MTARVEVTGLDHVGILTRDFDTVRRVLGAMEGVEVVGPETESEIGLEVLWVHVGGVALEFIRALDPDGETARRLARQPAGVNHIALTVTDVAGSLEASRAAGVATSDDVPRRGVHGSRIGFLEAGAVAGTLVEFVEPAPVAGP
jgi:methylmalonyl-CoA epimerase